MRALTIVASILFAIVSACRSAAPSSVPPAAAPQIERDAELDRARELLGAAQVLAGDTDRARALTREAVDCLLTPGDPEWNGARGTALADLGSMGLELEDPVCARRALLGAVERLSAALAADDPALLAARLDLARAHQTFGDMDEASAQVDAVVESRARSLPAEHPDLLAAQQVRARALRSEGGRGEAREILQHIVEVRERMLPADDPALLSARGDLALALAQMGDLHAARAMQEPVLELLRGVLPEDHRTVRLARFTLAIILEALGDLRAARSMAESLLDSARHLPSDHPHRVVYRRALGLVLTRMREFRASREHLELVLEAQQRTLAESDPKLQIARMDLAQCLMHLGELHEAHRLFETAETVLSASLPESHPDLVRTRFNLAQTSKALGDLRRALDLEQRILAEFERTLPEDHPSLLVVRSNLAATLEDLGERERARDILEEVVAVLARIHPEDQPDLHSARQFLAHVVKSLGDLNRARAIEERELQLLSRRLPEDHRDLLVIRTSLAATLVALGDMAGARALYERILELRSASLADDHPDLLIARYNLARTLLDLGRGDEARELAELILAVRLRTLPKGDRSVLRTRGLLAEILLQVGDARGARAVQEEALGDLDAGLPRDHPDVLAAWTTMGNILRQLGDLDAARTVVQEVYDTTTQSLDDDHPTCLVHRQNLASLVAMQAARKAGTGSADLSAESDLFFRLSREQGRAWIASAHRAALAGTARETEERCARMARGLAELLSAARGRGVFQASRELEHDAFELAQATRGAALSAARLSRAARSAPDYAARRAALSQASERLAALVRGGTAAAEYAAARAARDAAERALIDAARAAARGRDPGVACTAAALSRALEHGSVALSFRRHEDWRARVEAAPDATGLPAVVESTTDRMCAFVVRGGGAQVDALALVDLGPVQPIAEAVDAWRRSLGAAGGRGIAGVTPGPRGDPAESGAHVRRLVLDPLLPAVGDSRRIVVEADDVLHLIPFDTLPLDAGGATLAGDRWRIEHRSALGELLQEPAPGAGTHALLVVGGVDYGAGAEGSAAEVAGLLRGGAWSGGFPALPATRAEAHGVGQVFAAAFGAAAGITLLEGAAALRPRVLEAARAARFVHLATHGWFAPESVRSWSDPRPLDAQSGLGLRTTGAEAIRGLSPMLLCGLALSAANAPEDAAGRAPGLLTADEISAQDLEGCELAVLSACDTSVGEQRAGQGLASLQRALHMAGVRTTITSLWKVPDDPTRELMLDFYRRVWVEGQPKAEALWAAKRSMREARDERGAPRHAVRDWAGWVLTGDPR